MTKVHPDFFSNAHKSYNVTMSISILIDLSLTVKAATLIFISGRGSVFHLLNKGYQVIFIIWCRINKLFGPRKRACIHEIPNCIHTELTFINR